MPAHKKSGPLVSCDRICQTGVLILVENWVGSILPPFTSNQGRRAMTTAEIKASQLISDYGRDMAISQAKFFLGRANGGLQTWWHQVLVTIRSTPTGRRGDLLLNN